MNTIKDCSNSGSCSVTPLKSYPCFRSPHSGKTKVSWTPSAKKVGSVVYRFKYEGRAPSGIVRKRYKVVRKRYIGQTGNFSKRVSSHLSLANCHKQSSLYADLRRSPEKFSVGIIQRTSRNNLDAIEKKCITVLDTIHSGYNIRNGGGGGKTQPQIAVSKKQVEKAFAILKKTYHSPKHYPLSIYRGRIVHRVPRSIAKRTCQIYDIMRTTREGKKIHYIGYTSTSVARRLSSHLCYANNAKSTSSLMYQQMHNVPGEFSIAVLESKRLQKRGIPLPIIEELYTRLLKERGESLYNKTCGRNGSWSAHS